MNIYRIQLTVVALLLAGAGVSLAAEPAASGKSDGSVVDLQQVSALVLTPETVQLRGPNAAWQLLATGTMSQRQVDLTRQTQWRSEQPEIATVTSDGLVQPVSDGKAVIVVEAGPHQARAVVEVIGSAQLPAVDFKRDIIPLFTRLGCNQGACHGKARGQNGFQLSLLGFDDEFDFNALTREARGRRVFPTAPVESLLLQKMVARVPHGGGKRAEIGDAAWNVMLSWISSGTPRSQPGTPELTSVTVEPAERIMRDGELQQLAVTAHYSDGTTQDVTRLAQYQSNESSIAAVDDNGLISAGMIVGEAAVMARYMGMIAVCRVPVPLPGEVPASFYAELPRKNYIDGLVWQKLERLGLTPSAPAEDSTFIRRATVDIIGRVPTPEETREFLADSSPDRREKLVDRLLDDPEFADHQANRWADLLRPNAYRVGIKSVLNYDAWIRDAFRQNMPYDQFVKELISASGGTWRNGATNLYRDRRSPDELTTIVSQLFLGIRLECAKCHHHPFEVWGQDDFYSFAAYFARIKRKGTGLSPPISGSEEFIYSGTTGDVKHPLTGEVLPPRPLFGEAPEVTTEEDPRVILADWIASADNPYFLQVAANRVWADMMGRGLVEPVDDLRATNPPSNGPLLEALGNDLAENGFDLKQLIRRIATSHVYGLSSLPSDRNVVDTRNYSRHYRTRLRAEVLQDSVIAVTGVPENYAAMPPGSNARQIWTHRIDSLFLDAFGRPDPNQDPPCERTTETTVVQALHLMNAETLYRKVTSDSGTAATLAASDKTPEQIIAELYLLAYSRDPDPEEVKIGLQVFAEEGMTRRQATEDLMWALLNTPEFVFED
ncbi:MAG: DUF1549 domain-containing protein [Planctomycetaceae bacterium]|nr:DUF1549 domain-containing protein [Planctomycetaceae bacterium]